MAAPHIDEQTVTRLLKRLRFGQTVDKLAKDIGVNRRTVFRYLSILVKQGHDIRRVGISRPTVYKLYR